MVLYERWLGEGYNIDYDNPDVQSVVLQCVLDKRDFLNIGHILVCLSFQGTFFLMAHHPVLSPNPSQLFLFSYIGIMMFHRWFSCNLCRIVCGVRLLQLDF